MENLKLKGYEIEIAGILAPDIFTISGKKEEMDRFINDFNSEVKCLKKSA